MLFRSRNIPSEHKANFLSSDFHTKKKISMSESKKRTTAAGRRKLNGGVEEEETPTMIVKCCLWRFCRGFVKSTHLFIIWCIHNHPQPPKCLSDSFGRCVTGPQWGRGRSEIAARAYINTVRGFKHNLRCSSGEHRTLPARRTPPSLDSTVPKRKVNYQASEEAFALCLTRFALYHVSWRLQRKKLGGRNIVKIMNS